MSSLHALKKALPTARAQTGRTCEISFAHGGKDRFSYAADRKTMDDLIQTLKKTIHAAETDSRERMHSWQALRRLISEDVSH